MPLAATTPSPAKARRVAGSDEAVDSLVKAGASAGRGDDTFVETVMRNNPGVGTYVAGVWRQKTIQIAMARIAESHKAKSALGKKLDARCHHLGYLSKPFMWNLFFAMLAKCRKVNEAVITAEGWVIADSQTREFVLMAL